MSNYFEFLSQELLAKLAQVKCYITKHNQTIGVLTEEIVRDFLRNHLPKLVSVEQGFIIDQNGELTKQCDILIYDSQSYAPLYRVNDIVVIPAEAVLAVIEVKTSINKAIFHSVIEYFSSFGYLPNAKTYLFIFNSNTIEKIDHYLSTYVHKDDRISFDHDTFQQLPDEITGINESYHLRKDSVITERDMMGYSSWFYEDSEGTDLNALQQFYLSIHTIIEAYINENYRRSALPEQNVRNGIKLKYIQAIELFSM